MAYGDKVHMATAVSPESPQTDVRYLLLAGETSLNGSRILAVDLTTPLSLSDDGTNATIGFDQTLLALRQITKTTDETIASDNTFTADAVLKFTTVANTKYRFRLVLFVTTDPAPDFKLQLTHAGTTTTVWYHETFAEPASTAMGNGGVRNALATSIPFIVAGPGSVTGCIIVEGYLDVGASGGQFALEWAQNTSDVANTTVRAGSSLEYRILP